MGKSNSNGMELRAPSVDAAKAILTSDALAFLGELEGIFGNRRRALLEERRQRQARLDAGELPDFLPETRAVRHADWTVAPPPPDLQDRRVEITGPVDRKMMINALNSGANVYMADFEDSLSPMWAALVQGQQNLIDAVKGAISFEVPGGKTYRLAEKTATLVVRPRGLHMDEPHLRFQGKPVAASFFDAGLFLFHCADLLTSRATAPYLYLSKLESHQEAKLWADVFVYAERRLGMPHGTIRATVLIETLPAAFEMDEILHALKDHALGLNPGRWDYIFSIIKKLRTRKDSILPDRAQITMTAPFLRAYTQLLVETCHRRGAHAIGGMSAYLPDRKDPTANERALEQVRQDKLREVGEGFDGTWVAHPDLVPLAREVFDGVLGDQPNQVHRRPGAQVAAQAMLDVTVPGGRVTLAGLRSNIRVAMHYLDAWLQGTGAVVLASQMEDTATAEIARAQVWQWLRHRVALEGGNPITPELVRSIVDEEVAAMAGARRHDARRLFLDVCSADFVDFLTLPGQTMLEPIQVNP